MARQTQDRRSNALKPGRELSVRIQEQYAGSPEDVFDVLADLRTHIVWGGQMQKKRNFRLLSLEAPEGGAMVGTEFRTTGADPAGRFSDASVVTEADRPRVFEFVTEAHLERKRGVPVDWTNVHRYEIDPAAGGSRVTYTIRIVQLSALPGAMAMFRVPVLSAIGLKVSASYARRGLRNLLKLAQERAASR